jgi:hypothetical protein
MVARLQPALLFIVVRWSKDLFVIFYYFKKIIIVNRSVYLFFEPCRRTACNILRWEKKAQKRQRIQNRI